MGLRFGWSPAMYNLCFVLVTKCCIFTPLARFVQVICITNYINRERDNIKFMTIRMGAAYSGPLTRGRSTHLVAARYG